MACESLSGDTEACAHFKKRVWKYNYEWADEFYNAMKKPILPNATELNTCLKSVY